MVIFFTQRIGDFEDFFLKRIGLVGDLPLDDPSEVDGPFGKVDLESIL